ncbi:MAG: hypothetical protein GYA62_06680, partial [Bacteroidales bacterium]|nr:hypothetical protein [Bacteroidales bacterium]
MLSIGAQSPTGENFYNEIKPISQDYVQIKKDFCELHGLQRERLLKEAPNTDVVMNSFSEWLKKLQNKYGKPVIFTAFNAAFDWAWVDLYFMKSGLDNPFGIAPFDLKSLALPLTNGWNWKETSKDRLPKIILPDGDFAHHALKDAQYQQMIHFGMAGLLGNRKYHAIIGDR